MASLGTIEFEFKPLADKFIQQTEKIADTFDDLRKSEAFIDKETGKLNKTFSTTAKIVGVAGLAGGIALLAKNYKVLDKLQPTLAKGFSKVGASTSKISKTTLSAGGAVRAFGADIKKVFDSRAFRVIEAGPLGLIKSVQGLVRKFAVGGVSATAFGAALGAAGGGAAGLGAALSSLGLGMFNLLGLASTLTAALGTRLRKAAIALRRSNDEAVHSFITWEKTLFSLQVTIDGFNKKLGIAAARTSDFVKLTKAVSNATGFTRQEVAQASLILLEFSQNTGLATDAVKDLTARSADYATVTGQDYQTVIQGINNYFRGYSQTLQTVGINITETDLAQTKYVKSLNKA